MMNFLHTSIVLALMWSALPAAGQDTVPLYRVTVIERSLQAVNYQYKSGPTKIDFKGTVLLGNAKGRATVESRQGRTEVDAKLQGLTSPQGFGKEYLTYVLWAISPEGAPRNLGEVVTNGSNNAHVRVTTELQAFGLLITAEPYAAVRQPSDVVVMENQVRPETLGTIKPIMAKAELLPRGHYVLDQQKKEELLNGSGPKVSMNEYEQISQIYQAESALNSARAVNADTLAPDTFSKAQTLLNEAKQKRANKAGMAFVVQSAREAAQTADDARVIAMKRSQEKRIADAEQRAAVAERELRENVPAPPAPPVAAAPPPPPPPVPVPRAEPPAGLHLKVRGEAQDAVNPQTRLRGRLLSELRRVAEPIDTPRGVSLAIADGEFAGGDLSASAQITLARVAQIVATTGLRVTVEGNSDSIAGEPLSLRRAESVRKALVAGGLGTDFVAARGLANTRPTTANATEAGRTANRRVEIVIAGGAIGETPLWDRAYPITRR